MSIEPLKHDQDLCTGCVLTLLLMGGGGSKGLGDTKSVDDTPVSQEIWLYFTVPKKFTLVSFHK